MAPKSNSVYSADFRADKLARETLHSTVPNSPKSNGFLEDKNKIKKHLNEHESEYGFFGA